MRRARYRETRAYQRAPRAPARRTLVRFCEAHGLANAPQPVIRPSSCRGVVESFGDESPTAHAVGKRRPIGGRKIFSEAC
jgi:hypothetical protein